MRFATTIVLALAVLLFGFYAFLDHSGVLERFVGGEKPPALVAPVAEAITAFTLQNGEDQRALELKDGSWRITSPVRDVADPQWVRGALDTFANLQASEFLADDAGARRAEYGLSPELATTLTIQLLDEKKLVYQIGQQGPFPESTYLYPGAPDSYEGAYVAAGDFSGISEKPVSGIVDPVLARFDPDQVVKLSFRDEDGEAIELTRKGGAANRWALTQPARFQADEDRMNTLLTTLATLPVSSVTLNTGSAPAAPPERARVLTLEMAGEKTEKIVLTFFAHPSEPELVQARHSGRSLLYSLPADLVTSLFPQDPHSLRERHLMRVAAADIQTVVITPQGGSSLRLEHVGTWLLNSENGETTELANPDQAVRFLAALNELEVAQFLEDGPGKAELYGLDQPLYVMEITGDNLGPQLTDRLVMRVGMPLGNESPHVFVSFEETGVIAAVPKSFLTSLAQAADPLSWKKLEVLNVAFDLIESVHLDRRDKAKLTLKADLLHEDADKRLQLEVDGTDRTTDMDRHAALQLLLDLGNLHAERWLTTLKDSAIALATPSLVVQIRSRAEAESGDEPEPEAKENQEKEGPGLRWTLKFAPINAQGSAFYYGQLEGTSRPEPFLITREHYQRLAGDRLLLQAP